MQFKDVIGQAEVKKHLVDMIQSNRLSHALLLLGNDGVGALPLALAFAQYVVCEKAGGRKEVPAEASLFGEALPEPILLNDACGTCSACVKAAQYAHPDIHFSYPVIKKKESDRATVSLDFIKEWREFLTQHPYGNSYDWLQFIEAENKQGKISAEECNRLVSALSLKSFESVYKVLIMWIPEALGKEGNKLLKLIEEPPANTLMILVAEKYENILPTIISRCQLVKIPALENKDIQDALIQQGVDNAKAAHIADLSEGSYREALAWNNDNEHNWETVLKNWLNAIVAGGPIGVAKWVAEISEYGREQQKQFLQYTNQFLAKCCRLRYLGDTMEMASSMKEFALKINKMIGVGQIEAIIEKLDDASYYVERNAHAKILFHALSIQLLHIIKENAVILTD